MIIPVEYIFTTNPTNNSDYRDGIEIGDVWSADAEFRIKGTMQGYTTGNGVLTNYDGGMYAQTRWFFVGGNMYYDMNGGRIQTSFTPTSGVDFDYTISNWGVYDNLTSSYVMSGTPKSSIQAGVVWLNMRTCKISSIEVKQGNTVVFNGVAAYDSVNGNIGLYDSVSNTLKYNSNLSMTKGADLYIFNIEPLTLSFKASGGTSSITVNAETGFTCTTPTGFTLSTTAGTSGETTITVTAPDYTGNTKKSEVIIFTDDNGHTIEATLKQKAYSPGGLYNCFLGDTEGTFYLGGLEVSNMYLGEIEVYSSGPYIGLKLTPSTISFRADSGLTQTLKVKSSEAWTLALPNDATWLSASTLSGVSGETTVTLSTTEENTGDTRTVVITATTTSFSATCTVNQNKMFVDNYMFNYNAKEYDTTTHSFPKKNGQLFDEDLVLNSNVSSVNTDYVSISGQWMGKTYSSTAENPFNRGGASGTEFTFIYKAKFNNTDDMHNIISNRGNVHNYFIRYPWSWCGGNSIQMTPSQQPATIITTVDSSGNGVRKCVETQQIGTSNNCTFGSHSNAIGFFSGYGTNLSEQFNGDFYWMFLANRKLTDDEIQIVIDYNENL